MHVFGLLSVSLPKKFCRETRSFYLHVPVPRQQQTYPKDDWLGNWCLTSQREYFIYLTPVRYQKYVRICRSKKVNVQHICTCFIFYEVFFFFLRKISIC